MGSNLDELVGRIQQEFPTLEFSESELIDHGWDHAIVVVDRKVVFRFPRTAAYAATFSLELALLRRLRLTTSVSTPDYSMVAKDLSFGGYPLIEGRGLSAPVFAAMNRPSQEALVVALADFLSAMHVIPADVMTLPGGRLRTDGDWAREDAERYFQRRRPILEPYVDPRLLARLDKAHEHYPRVGWRSNAMIHGDFREDHILLAPDADRLGGVIDFGDAVVGDAARDFTFFHALGDWALELALSSYRGTENSDGLRERSGWSFIRHGASRLMLAVKGHEGYDANELVRALDRQLNALGV